MSVGERIYVGSDRSPAALAADIAAALGARVSVHPGKVEVLLPTETVLPGVAGEFGGPLLRHRPDGPSLPPGEWYATDAYDLEWRLWQAYGPRYDREKDVDLEHLAASAVFDRLAATIDAPMVHLHQSDELAAAYHPEHGFHRYPRWTLIYSYDEDKWGRWILPASALSRGR
jgi:hypothetical protein